MQKQNVLNDIGKLLDGVQETELLMSVKALIDAKLEEVKVIELEKFKILAQELQSNYGIEVTELTSALSNNHGKGLKLKGKYRSKTDPRDTWTGRGKQPRWVTIYLAESPTHTLADLLTDKPTPNNKPNGEQVKPNGEQVFASRQSGENYINDLVKPEPEKTVVEKPTPAIKK